MLLNGLLGAKYYSSTLKTSTGTKYPCLSKTCLKQRAGTKKLSEKLIISHEVLPCLLRRFGLANDKAI